MLKLRKLVYACFFNAALIYTIVSIHSVSTLISTPFPRTTDQFHQESFALKTLAILLLTLSRLIMALPPVLAGIFGMAWWRLSSGHRSGPRWGFTASVFLLLSAFPLLPGVYDMIHHPEFPAWISITCAIVSLVSLAAGVSGIVAFRKSAAPVQPASIATLPRIAGDGTHRYLDAIGIILQVGATVWLMESYSRWGYELGLPFTHGVDAWVQWFLVIGTATLLHESGHAFTGIALGMKLRAFIVGPFQFRVIKERWKFAFRPKELLAFSGAAGLVPVNAHESRWNEVAVIAAGPFVNLLSAAVAAALAYSAVGSSWEFLWEYFALFATVSLVAGTVNLIPLRPEGLYSDGARILQIFRGGPLYDYQRATRIAQAGSCTPIRPRDFDIAAIDRASVHFTTGEVGLLLRLWATEHYLDRADLSQARSAFAQAEDIFKNSASDVRAGLHACMVINAALTRHDAEATCSYWLSMKSKQVDDLDSNYWQAQCAFHWSESRLDLAREVWDAGRQYLAKLTDTGGNNYDRDCQARLFEIIEASEPPANLLMVNATCSTTPS